MGNSVKYGNKYVKSFCCVLVPKKIKQKEDYIKLELDIDIDFLEKVSITGGLSTIQNSDENSIDQRLKCTGENIFRENDLLSSIQGDNLKSLLEPDLEVLIIDNDWIKIKSSHEEIINENYVSRESYDEIKQEGKIDHKWNSYYGLESAIRIPYYLY